MPPDQMNLVKKKEENMARSKHTTARSESEPKPKRNKKVTKAPLEGGITKTKGKKKKSRQAKINIKANREIRYQQKKSDTIIPKMAYLRIVKKHIADITGRPDNGIRISSNAKDLLQRGVETNMIELFENADYVKNLLTTRMRLESRDLIGPIKSDTNLKTVFVPWLNAKEEEIKQEKEKKLLDRVQTVMQEKVEAAEENQKKKEDKEKRKQEKEKESEEPAEKEKKKKKKKSKEKKHKKRSKPDSENESELSSKQKSKKKKKKSKD